MSELEKLESLELNNPLAVNALEKACLTQEQIPCPVVHKFGPGIYIRQVSIPAGTFSIGHHQNLEHMNILFKGKVSMVADDGSVSTVSAPFSYAGKPGRKIGYIHEDMVWLNIYATDETDIEKLEAKYLTKSDYWLENNTKESLKLVQNTVDNDDFKLAIQEFGLSEETVKKQTENEDDMTEMPYGSYKFKVDSSSIQGFGVFAVGDYAENEIIGVARIEGKRTVLGRRVNHSINPNSVMIPDEHGNIYLKAIKPISGCLGGFNGNEITINYRDAVKLTLLLTRGE